MKEIQGQLGVNKQQLISLLGSTMYRSNVQEVAVKELLQNAFDAVKIANALGQQDNPQITVELDSNNRIVTVSDNGIGMSPEIVQKAFFTIGGSYKGENIDNRLKSGGLGLAKMAFLFSSKSIKVNTVKDGIRTEVDVTPEEIQNDDFKLKVSHTDDPNGTTVSVVIPEYYLDENDNRREIYFSNNPSFLNRPMVGNVQLTIIKKSWSNQTTVQDKRELPKGYQSIGNCHSEFGDIELYVAPSSGGCYIDLDILISGLYQFGSTIYLKDNQRSRMKVIANILPSVGVQSPIYPINNQREGFRATVSPEIDDLRFFLKKINGILEKKSIAEAFGHTISMNVDSVSTIRRIPTDSNQIIQESVNEVKRIISEFTGVKMENSINLSSVNVTRKYEEEKKRNSSLDTSDILFDDTVGVVDTSGLDINKPIFHNNTNMIIEEDAQRVLDKIGEMMLQLKSLYIQTYENADITCRHGNVINYIKSQYWGISMDKNYCGVNVSPRVMSLLAINPFGKKLPAYKGVDMATYLTRMIIHIIQHEFNHNYICGEYSDFTARLVETEAEFDGIGESFQIWTKQLYELVSANLSVFVKYHERYGYSENIAISFEAER